MAVRTLYDLHTHSNGKLNVTKVQEVGRRSPDVAHNRKRSQPDPYDAVAAQRMKTKGGQGHLFRQLARYASAYEPEPRLSPYLAWVTSTGSRPLLAVRGLRRVASSSATHQCTQVGIKADRVWKSDTGVAGAQNNKDSGDALDPP